MKLSVDSNGEIFFNSEIKILTAFHKNETSKAKKSSDENLVSIDHWKDSSLKEEFLNLKALKHFKANKDEVITFSGTTGDMVYVVGLGDKLKFSSEDLRKTIAKIYKLIKGKAATISIDINGFNTSRDEISTCQIIAESLYLSNYQFEKYKSKKSESAQAHIILGQVDKKNLTKINNALTSTQNICSSIDVMKDFINEAPNFLHSEEYATRIEKDVKQHLKGVKIKVLNKSAIIKEKMGMFLSVNAGSAYEPRLVHLSYTPAKVTSKTKHIALVGKGITFDTGGYCIKPGTSMAGMKNDMGGSATVYGAFRAAVLEKAPVKITCILAITDNAINELATVPDAIVTARNGKTVEILNTDAEGRLILGDALDYACDLKPDYIIDAATLTGAALVALGNQVAAILGNDQAWINNILSAAKEKDEYMWQLPIIPEWRQDIKSKVADLKNIGTPMRAGTAIGAAFLEEFIKNEVKWAHLDIAGVVDAQSHLPYCSAHGASGLMVRTLVHVLMNA